MTQRELTFFGFEREHENLDRWKACLERVLASGELHSSGSSFTAALETQFADRLGRRRVAAVGSGTEALRLSLEALELGYGEVIVPSFTFQASVAAIVRAGLVPRFADIDKDTLQIDTESVASHIGPSTVAVLAVHLFGIPAPVGELHDLCAQSGTALVEDCAQAVGARTEGGEVGTFGAVAAFSCGPTKALAGFGEGGLIAYDDDDLDVRLRRLRHNGAISNFEHSLVGTNAMLDSLQGAFLLERLRTLDEELDDRRRVVAQYRAALDDEELLRVVGELPGQVSAPTKLTVVLDASVERDAVETALVAAGVPVNVYYRVPQHRQPCFAHLPEAHLPVTDDLAGRVLSMPLHTALLPCDVERVASELRHACRASRVRAVPVR